MAVQITIPNVPEEVRAKLAAHAVRQRQSMEEFLLKELERIASRPSNTEWVRELREWKKVHAKPIPTSVILEAKDADKR